MQQLPATSRGWLENYIRRQRSKVVLEFLPEVLSLATFSPSFTVASTLFVGQGRVIGQGRIVGARAVEVAQARTALEGAVARIASTRASTKCKEPC